MNRLWRAPGVVTMMMLLALILVITTRDAGIFSLSFLRSAIILSAVAGIALAIRYHRLPR